MTASVYRYSKPLCFVVSVAPLVWLGYQLGLYATGSPLVFGADPGKEIVLYLGEWALVMLLVTLSATPLQAMFKLRLVPLRRMLGLFTFFYAALHLLAYLVLLLGLDFAGFWADLIKRPYITAGAAGLLLMVPLAITSTAEMRRRLGKSWKKLHQLIYLASVCVIIHFFWQTRSDFTEVLLYSALLAWLMAYRVFKSQRVQGLLKKPKGRDLAA